MSEPETLLEAPWMLVCPPHDGLSQGILGAQDLRCRRTSDWTGGCMADWRAGLDPRGQALWCHLLIWSRSLKVASTFKGTH